MEDIIDIIVTETTNTIEITSQASDELIDVNIIDNREDITLNVTPTLVEININSLTGNFGVSWGDIDGTLSNQTDLQNALNLKADLVDGKVPSSQLPSYVDDVVEVATYSALPATGEVGKIYVVLDTNLIYRWSGSAYIEIKDSSAVWGAITGTLSSQTDLQSALDAKQNQLNGTGFVKASGTSISYDNSTYLTTSSAASTYVPYTGATGAVNLGSNNITAGIAIVNQVKAVGSGGLSINSNNGTQIANLGGGGGANMTLYGGLSGTSISLSSTLTASSIIKTGGTSAQFLKADGSVDSTLYVSGSGATGYYARFTGSRVISDGFIQTTSNITYIEGMGLSTLNGLDITGNYGAGGGGLKIRSYDETTGNAYIDFANTGGRFYLGVNRSTASGLMTNATAYATVLTTGLGTTNLEFGTNATKRLTLDGTTGAATFTSSVTASSLYVTGMTAGNGAIYHTGSRLTFANYNAGGTLHFEVDGGGAALTISTNKSATFLGDAIISKASPLTVYDRTDTNQFSGLQLKTSGTNNFGLGLAWNGASTDFEIYNYSLSSTALKINYSNNAATFSSSVTADRVLTTNNANNSTLVAGSIEIQSFALNNSWIGDNIFFNGSGFVARNTGYTSQIYFEAAGNIAFKTSPSTVSAGSASNNVNRMIITSAGNVGIGTTSPQGKLDITGTTSSDLLYLDAGVNTDYAFKVVTGADDMLTLRRQHISAGNRDIISFGFSGNVGIGTTAPSGKLDVVGDVRGYNYALTSDGVFRGGLYPYKYISGSGSDYGVTIFAEGGTGNGNIYFCPGGSATRAATINTLGRLIVGSTSDGATGLVQIHGTARAVQLVASQGGITAGNYAIYGHDDDNGYINVIRSVFTGDFHFRFDGTTRATINRSTGVYVATSDINKKKELEESKIGLSEVMQLKPTLYRMKIDNTKGEKELGFIAQDVKGIIPSAYQESGDFIGLNYNPIVAALTKAVQELKAELDTLKNK
jgi:hypothetical protein